MINSVRKWTSAPSSVALTVRTQQDTASGTPTSRLAKLLQLAWKSKDLGKLVLCLSDSLLTQCLMCVDGGSGLSTVRMSLVCAHPIVTLSLRFQETILVSHSLMEK